MSQKQKERELMNEMNEAMKRMQRENDALQRENDALREEVRLAIKGPFRLNVHDVAKVLFHSLKAHVIGLRSYANTAVAKAAAVEAVTTEVERVDACFEQMGAEGIMTLMDDLAQWHNDNCDGEELSASMDYTTQDGVRVQTRVRHGGVPVKTVDLSKVSPDSPEALRIITSAIGDMMGVPQEKIDEALERFKRNMA